MKLAIRIAISACLWAYASAALAGDRVALVIGNNAYSDLAALANPGGDAKKVAAELKAHGYRVLEAYDLTREKFLDTLETFAKDYARGASEAFVFYAGHGLSSDGRDVLAPIDMQVECDSQSGQLRTRREVAWDEVERQLKEVPNLVVVLDACRTSAFKACTRSADEAPGFRGLTRSAGSGRLIVNSTALGAVAGDGPPGAGSPFANVLLKHLRSEANAYFRDLFDEVARDVNVATAGGQVPAVLAQGGAPHMCLSGKCGEHTVESAPQVLPAAAPALPAAPQALPADAQAHPAAPQAQPAEAQARPVTSQALLAGEQTLASAPQTLPGAKDPKAPPAAAPLVPDEAAIPHAPGGAGWLGVQIQNVDERVARAYGLREIRGAIILEVFANGPASRSELRREDIVLLVNGKAIYAGPELARAIAALAPGSTARLRVFRNGSERDISVTLGAASGVRTAASQGTPDRRGVEFDELGLVLAPASDFPGVENGEGMAVIFVEPDSEAAGQGIRAGDVIAGLNSKRISTLGEVTALIAEARNTGLPSITLQCRGRDARIYYVRLHTGYAGARGRGRR